MGIFDWVKSQTGVWGPALLDMYLHNASWINAVALIYGLLLLLSWQNLSRVSDALVEQILEQAGKMKGAKIKGKTPKTINLSDFNLSWENAFASSKFPFVARQSGLVIRRSNLENARALINDRDLIQRCARRLDEMGLRLERSR
jgi:hypothetical protein